MRVSPKAVPGGGTSTARCLPKHHLLRDRIMSTSKSIRESRRARRRRRAEAPSTPSTVVKFADLPAAPIPPALANEYAKELAGSMVKLARVRGVVTTAFLALKHQNVERDWDIASTLQFSAVDVIASVEEDTWRIVAALDGETHKEETL